MLSLDIGSLTQDHFVELHQGSGIDPALIQLNFRSLDGDLPYDYLCYADSLERTNTGRLTTPLLQRYEHTESGGWWCNGLDPLNNWAPMAWGCFKPDRPRLAFEQAKSIKYEHPPQLPTRSFFLDVPESIWQQVADRYGLSLPEDRSLGFWPWVVARNLPIILVEGAKKAACLLSLGYAAIAIPGVWNGRRKADSDLPERLIPDFQVIATQDREIYFCFDRDEKAATRETVADAICRTAALLRHEGCTVRVIQLPGPDKGVDDFILARGHQAFESLYRRAPSLASWAWHRRRIRHHKLPAWMQVNQPLLDISPLLEHSPPGLIALQSPKGTGKTQAIAQLLAHSGSVVLLTHRICLGRNLSARVDVDWKGDLDKGDGLWIAEGERTTRRIGLCVDSLLSLDPRDFIGCDVAIDEVDQVLRHLLGSSTCNQHGKRPLLLARLQQLLQNARRVIVASADLSDIDLTYLLQLMGEDTPLWLVRNDTCTEGYPVRYVDCPQDAAIIADLLADARQGLKLFVATDSLNCSKTLAKLLAPLQTARPEIGVMVINSETSGGAEAIEFVRDINQRVTDFDIVIATPSLATGISIEVEHIDKVYGIFRGVLPDGDLAQALARVRPAVPREIWCATRGKSFCHVHCSDRPEVVKAALKTRWDRETELVRLSLGSSPLLRPELQEQEWEASPHIHLWAEQQADRNFSLWGLQEHLLARLEHEGHRIERVPMEATEEAKERLKLVKAEIKQEYREAVSAAAALSRRELQAIEMKEGRSPEDLLREQKTKLVEFYATDEITPELVQRDNQGRLRGQIVQLEALCQGSEATATQTAEAINRQAVWNGGIFQPDLHCYETRRFIRERLRLPDFLTDRQEWSERDLDPLGDLVRQHRQDIGLYLNLHVPEDASNGWILCALLAQVGVKVTHRRQGARGEQVKLYRLEGETWAFLTETLARRQQRQQARQALRGGETETVSTPPPFDKTDQKGVDTGDLNDTPECTSLEAEGKITPQGQDAPPSGAQLPPLVGTVVEWLGYGGQWIVESAETAIAFLRRPQGEQTWMASFAELRY